MNKFLKYYNLIIIIDRQQEPDYNLSFDHRSFGIVDFHRTSNSDFSHHSYTHHSTDHSHNNHYNHSFGRYNLHLLQGTITAPLV